MELREFQYKNRSRYVALFNLLLTVIYLVVLSTLDIYLGMAMSLVTDNFARFSDLWEFWLGATVIVLLVLADIWIDIVLFLSTREGITPKYAIRRAYFWLFLNTLTLLLIIVYAAFARSFIIAPMILLRLVFEVIVYLYVSELENAVITEKTPQGIVVLVAK